MSVSVLAPLTARLARPRVFFFNDTATTEIYTLSLHDALPISLALAHMRDAFRLRHDGHIDEVRIGDQYQQQPGADRDPKNGLCSDMPRRRAGPVHRSPRRR